MFWLLLFAGTFGAGLILAVTFAAGFVFGCAAAVASPRVDRIDHDMSIYDLGRGDR